MNQLSEKSPFSTNTLSKAIKQMRKVMKRKARNQLQIK